MRPRSRAPPQRQSVRSASSPSRGVTRAERRADSRRRGDQTRGQRARRGVLLSRSSRYPDGLAAGGQPAYVLPCLGSDERGARLGRGQDAVGASGGESWASGTARNLRWRGYDRGVQRVRGWSSRGHARKEAVKGCRAAAVCLFFYIPTTSTHCGGGGGGGCRMRRNLWQK